LKEKDIMHRNIKPENIILNNENCIKLIGFEECKKINNNMN